MTQTTKEHLFVIGAFLGVISVNPLGEFIYYLFH